MTIDLGSRSVSGRATWHFGSAKEQKGEAAISARAERVSYHAWDAHVRTLLATQLGLRSWRFTLAGFLSVPARARAFKTQGAARADDG